MKENRRVYQISIGQLANLLKESTANGQRFCFILGSGASVTSGIPMGRTLEKRWMDCLMGLASDGKSPAKDPADTERVANMLYAENIIETPFEKLKAAWEDSKKPGGYIPSEYYFDIYKLRFYPERRNGYKYLEQLMEKAKPSVGYHPLARLLAEDNGIDIIITTNFDSLTEDALFIFTDERPLVVAHESLADFIDLSKKQRPVVAKVHRGLFYGPLNEKESTSELSEGWKEALGEIFMQYTPIVIGYAGGDRSLMSFLEEKSTRLRHGLYWCLMKGEKPEERIEKLVAAKDGCFVEINGFDDAMLVTGEKFLGESLIPTKTIELLKKSAEERGEEYDRQWTEWEKRRKEEKAGHDEAIAKLTEAEKKEEDKREEKKELTAGDHLRRGHRAYYCDDFGEALAEYSRAIEINPNYTEAYIDRGYIYDDLQEYDRAIEDNTDAIRIDPHNVTAYVNRSFVYYHIGDYENAIVDAEQAIRLDPLDPYAYCNKGIAYDCLGNHEEAVKALDKCLELLPANDTENRALGLVYRGRAYFNNKEYGKAADDYTAALGIDPEYIDAFRGRAEAYRSLGDTEKAADDERMADELEARKK